MIIDGAVNHVLKKNQGLFAQDVDLTLFDSIIGHEEGLSSLIQLMSKTRKKQQSLLLIFHIVMVYYMEWMSVMIM